MASKTISTGLAMLLIASVGYWASQNFAPDSPVVLSENINSLNITAPTAITHIFEQNVVQTVVIEDIQLRGVIKSSNKKESVAAISINKKPVQYVQENQVIQQGIVLKTISLDHIVIEENGIRKKIKSAELNKITIK